MRSPIEIARFKAVRKILLERWDPIGIVGIGGPHDEYDSYIWVIVRMASEGATPDALSAHLLGIERNAMGLPGNEPRGRTAAGLVLHALRPTT